jgi:hypothetical protein
MMMNNEFVPYDIALAMKELGFDEKCYGYYTEHKEYFYFDVDDLSSAYTKNMNNQIVNSVDDLECTAPLYQQAFRWFREKYDLHIGICHQVNGKFDCWANKGNLLENGKYCDIDSYEEAELACLRKLIEIVNQNKDE